MPEQIEEYNIPQNFDSDGYEVDALNAFNPQAFRDLIQGRIDLLFDKDRHKEILDLHPLESIDEIIQNKVKFLD